MKYGFNAIPLLKNISKKGFFNLLSANVLIQMVAFASQLFVAGILSPEDIGRIKILQTWLGIFSIIGAMGLNSSTLKLCSESRPKAEIQAIFKSGTYLMFITTLATYSLVLIFNLLGVLSKDAVIKSLIPLALLPLVGNAFFSIYINYYQALKNIKFISTLTILNKTLSVLLIIAFTVFWGIKGYFIGFNVGLAALVTIIVIKNRQVNSSSQSLGLSKKYFKLHWQYARPSAFSHILSDLSVFIDILLINFLISNIQEIGYYSFALTLTVIFKLLPATVQQITTPYFSFSSSNSSEFKRTYKKYSRMLFGIIIGILLVFLMIMPFFLNIFLDGKYNASTKYFIPLAIGWSIRQYNQVQSAALFGSGNVSLIAKSQLISLIFSVVITLTAILKWGLLGAAYSSILCAVISVAMQYFFLAGVLKKNAYP